MRTTTVCFVVALLGSIAASAQDVLIRGGTLLDPASGQASTDDLLIVDGRIAGRPTTPPADFKGEIVDATGKFVIPALHDLHTHSFGNMGPDRAMQRLGTPRASRLMLYAGIGGFLDLFAPEDAIFGLRNTQREGPGGEGADIFAAGPCMTATEGHCTEYGVPTRVVDSPEDARRQVDELAAKRPDVVKLVFDRDPGGMPTVDVATLRAWVEAAKRQGLKTVIHIGTELWDDVRDAALAGATALTHLPDGELVPDEVVAVLLERGTMMIPTLAVSHDMAWWYADPTRLENPLVQAVTSAEVRVGYHGEPAAGFVTRWVHRAVDRREVRHASIKKLADAGVPILTGTDAGNPGTFLAYSLHRELALLVDAGLTPMQALAASTTVAGEFMGRAWGLSEGDEGSVVLLDASPLDDIRNTEKISAVVHHGVVVDRAALLN